MAIAVAEMAEVTVASKRTETGKRMGDEIEAIRKEGPFTQQQVADRLRLSLATYLSYRRGYIRVTPNTLRKWASALDVSITELARRLEIDLFTDGGAPPDASLVALEERISRSVKPELAHIVDDIFEEIAPLPHDAQRQVLEAMLDQAAGRRARLDRD